MSASPDKLVDRELILCDNCRLDELGSIAATGASTKQNSVAYTDGSTTAIHSLHINPTVRHIALVGTDVHVGAALSGLASLLDDVNANSRKSTFAESEGRVFFQTSGVPRMVDDSGAAHTVDWATPLGAAANTAATSPATAASDNANGGTVAWSNPNNSFSSNDTYATAGPNAAEVTELLKVTNFSFAIPTGAQIVGIVASIERKQGTSSGPIFDSAVRLIKALVPVGDNKAVISTWPAADAAATYGSSSDLWGTTWTAAEINASGFGLGIAVVNSVSPGAVETASVDHITLTVYYRGAALVPAVSTIAGTLNSTYTYKSVFYDDEGNESSASEASAAVSPTNDAVNFTAIALGDSKTVGRRIYRKGGALAFYFRVLDIADNTSTTATDNLSDTDALSDAILLAGEVEGDPLNTRLGASTVVKFPAFYYDRLFWVQQSTNNLLWSRPAHPWAYPVEYQIPVGDEKEPTGLVPFLDDLIIFKPDGIWRLSGKNEGVFDLVRTPAAVGCDMPFTIVRLQDRIMFCNSKGLWYFDGVTARRATNRLDKFFDGQTWNGVSPISTNTTTNILAEAVYSNGIYSLAYSDNGSSLNNILEIDLDGGTITRIPKSGLRSLGINVAEQDVYIGDSSGFVRLIENATDDAGSSVAWAMQTKYVDPKRMSNKTFGAIELDIDTSGQSITPTVLFNQGGSSAALTAISTTTRTKVYCPIAASSGSRKGHNISVKLTGTLTTINESGSPAVTLYGIKIYYETLQQRARVSV